MVPEQFSVPLFPWSES